MKYRRLSLVPAAIVIAGPVFATTYLSIEEAQQVLFPGESFTRGDITLTKEQIAQIEKAADVNIRSAKLRVYRAGSGGIFLVDEVLGKHEFITFALALDSQGAVLGVEVLEYRETYGDEIRQPGWRKQFHGKKAADMPSLGPSIQNISGATLSCKHLTDGIRRLLWTYELALR